MERLSEIHAAVEKEVDRMRLTVHLHAHEFTQINEFVATLCRHDGHDGTYVSLGYTSGSLPGVIVQVHLSKEETFKACSPIIDFLFSSGWEQDKQTENVDWGYRQIAFKKMHDAPPLFYRSDKPWKPYKLTCTVRMWPHPLSTTCIKVEDGTEVKYKFACAE